MAPPMMANGEPILKIGKKGKRKFQIGDGPVIDVDIVATSNAWSEIRRSYYGEDGELLPDKGHALSMEVFKFVLDTQIGLAGLDQKQAEALSKTLSMAECLEFLRIVTEETDALRSFFEVKSPNAPDSSGTTTTLRYGE